MDLPPNAKLHDMQQNTHRLVQLIRAATANVPNQTPMPQASKQLLNACPIPLMRVIVRPLLIAGPSKFHSFYQCTCSLCWLYGLIIRQRS